ncbi:hypothetical protein Z517_04454 [Fonsecaea pedrosoi CBS 271.37]|uniref:Uncharacterized protein n=1 Tax=Fonsecaea pedrosoi CBS 271.37 TaxID=1442368 RepID=A0A0D2HA60_9EURO|nr:uncharacterized protein Z517_04454 [Fonsecaea pedrosoi CBS 271.37]KIW81429.1 hypothetical protein Z517_04454 [Fonsecaea pedrosoi CBS 271.37]
MGGMGVVVAKAILQSGADVIAIDRDAEPKASHTEDLYRAAEKSGTVVAYYQCDISNLESTYAAFEDAVAAARYPLRGLVNCAAIGWVGPSINFPVEDAKRIIEVNLVGTLICAQAAAQLVKKHNFSASFVFIASMSGYVVNKGTPNAAYAASKAGVQCTSSRATWRPNGAPRPTTRGPRSESTRNFDHLWTEEKMLKRLSAPEDYRGPIVFLLSDASSYVTGADLLVDGGYTGW